VLLFDFLARQPMYDQRQSMRNGAFCIRFSSRKQGDGEWTAQVSSFVTETRSYKSDSFNRL